MKTLLFMTGIFIIHGIVYLSEPKSETKTKTVFVFNPKTLEKTFFKARIIKSMPKNANEYLFQVEIIWINKVPYTEKVFAQKNGFHADLEAKTDKVGVVYFDRF